MPDFYFTALKPTHALSVAYCLTLPRVLACNDLSVCLIASMHCYHALCFKLSSQDLMHHVLFVPIICGIRFLYPGGSAGNILSFFISGFPGGCSYFLLAAVKGGIMQPIIEKRINCSINTWIRAPGIIVFVTLASIIWISPPEGTPAEHLPPVYMFVPVMFLCFFNGQYYAQRVIGNYYIRKAQDFNKRGIKHVELHTS